LKRWRVRALNSNESKRIALREIGETFEPPERS